MKMFEWSVYLRIYELNRRRDYYMDELLDPSQRYAIWLRVLLYVSLNYGVELFL